MRSTIPLASVRVDQALHDFVTREALPGTGIAPTVFWNGLASLFENFTPRIRALLRERERLQTALDDWHRTHPGPVSDRASLRAFLASCGYLRPQPAPFHIDTRHVDPEICRQAGPQLVVPVTNARYALNAANARWGSLYDALYGSDALTGSPPPHDGARDAERARAVVSYARDFLDRHFPLTAGSHRSACSHVVSGHELVIALKDGGRAKLVNPGQFAGLRGDPAAPSAILLRHHGLHVELHIDRNHETGRDDPAGISDIVLEAALTTIVDLEDSIAAVDADDKIAAYRNWLGLMRGSLSCDFVKHGKPVHRRLAADREWRATDGTRHSLPGRALMFLRHVGSLLTTPAVLLEDGSEAPEEILDAAVGSLIALHDLPRRANSRQGSIYVVKPKLHGPHEVACACDLFAAVEQLLQLPPDTIKLGIMDEERRTSLNLAACIAEARSRVVFINTGFLDRTGDEIHSAMEAGPMLRKVDMKQTRWIDAYERNNVQTGLACGLRGRAQIGKGMWAMPDRMQAMLGQKAAHPRAGANTAWVPSPTAAVLHTLHYHEVDVAAIQTELESSGNDHAGREEYLDALLDVPVTGSPEWSADAIREELENNLQGILGYVVRWVDQGIGCSKVPDIHNVGLMEDRATLRISSQLVANWLRHGVCSKEEVEAALLRMAGVVDSQNAGDPHYRPLSANPADNPAFQAARELVLQGCRQPNGYTEPILHRWRRVAKSRTIPG